MENEEYASEIEEKIGIKVKSATKIVGEGINNSLWRVTDSRNLMYAFKTYKLRTKNDPTDRLRNEINFLEHCKNSGYSKVPRLIKASRKGNWSLMEWINGRKLNTITEDDIKQIIEFIYKINCSDSAKTYFDAAPDSFTYDMNASKRLENRVNKLRQAIKKNKHLYEQNDYEWICNVILYESWKQINNFNKQHADTISWREENIVHIVSPSDVGIHNTIKYNNDLHFIDFEYAGLDDLAKLVSDWVLQPEYSFSKDQEECMLKGLIDMEIVKGKEWIERYHSIKTLTSLKWCLIMLKGTTGMKRLEQKRTINKTKKYYETLIASK